MRDYSGNNWSQEAPTSAELRPAFAHSGMYARPLDPRLARVQALFHEDRTSARMAAAQFDLDLDPAYVFYLERNRLPETLFFYELFNSLDFLEAVPGVGALRWSPSTLHQSWEGRTIGQGQGLDVKAEMQTRVFDRFEMPNTDMQWRDDFAENLADGYALDGSFEPHDERSWVSASGSMDTTIADQARMWSGMLAGEGLSPEMRAEWVRPQLPIRTATKFPTLPVRPTTDARSEMISLSAGLGVESWQGPNGPAFAKGGHNDWTGNIVICQEVERRCVVMLANSVRAEIIYPRIVEMILGETNYPWWWTYPALHGEAGAGSR